MEISMQFTQYLKKYAQDELQRIGFMESDFGETFLNFLDKCATISGNDKDTMKNICSMLIRTIDNQPLSPITEDDFEVEFSDEESKRSVVERCTRYPFVYKLDGKYWDDRAVVFVREGNLTDKMYLYQSSLSSKQEVKLPYYPQQQIHVLAQDFSLNPKIEPEPDYEVE